MSRGFVVCRKGSISRSRTEECSVFDFEPSIQVRGDISTALGIGICNFCQQFRGDVRKRGIMVKYSQTRKRSKP